jgi:hypothetical protein
MDRQKNKVYQWEDKNVKPYDINPVKLQNVQEIVNFIWEREGLKYPPKVSRLSHKSHKTAGTGNRLELKFRDITHTWIIIHEISHSMTCNIHNQTNNHNSLFLGIYIKLLNKYLNLPLNQLTESAKSYNLKFQLEAKPVFI